MKLIHVLVGCLTLMTMLWQMQMTWACLTKGTIVPACRFGDPPGDPLSCCADAFCSFSLRCLGCIVLGNNSRCVSNAQNDSRCCHGLTCDSSNVCVDPSATTTMATTTTPAATTTTPAATTTTPAATTTTQAATTTTPAATTTTAAATTTTAAATTTTAAATTTTPAATTTTPAATTTTGPTTTPACGVTGVDCSSVSCCTNFNCVNNVCQGAIVGLTGRR